MAEMTYLEDTAAELAEVKEEIGPYEAEGDTKSVAALTAQIALLEGVLAYAAEAEAAEAEAAEAALAAKKAMLGTWIGSEALVRFCLGEES
jgi:hypothetical protein